MTFRCIQVKETCSRLNNRNLKQMISWKLIKGKRIMRRDREKFGVLRLVLTRLVRIGITEDLSESNCFKIQMDCP